MYSVQYYTYKWSKLFRTKYTQVLLRDYLWIFCVYASIDKEKTDDWWLSIHVICLSVKQSNLNLPWHGIPIRACVDPWYAELPPAWRLPQHDPGCCGHTPWTHLPQGGYGVPLQICAHSKKLPSSSFLVFFICLFMHSHQIVRNMMCFAGIFILLNSLFWFCRS